MEFISALAAGNQARLMVDIASGGLSASTLALAVAATHVGGGRLVCVRHEREAIEEIKAQVEALDLERVTELRVGDPFEVMKQYKNIDFAVVDHRIRECLELLFAMEMNPSGSVVVVSNLFHGRRSVRSCTAFGQMMRSAGNKSAVLPIGDGMEITRFTGNVNGGRRGVRKSCKRTFMVYDEVCPPKFCGGEAKDVGVIMSS